MAFLLPVFMFWKSLFANRQPLNSGHFVSAYQNLPVREAVRHVQSIRSIVLVANVSRQDWDERRIFRE